MKNLNTTIRDVLQRIPSRKQFLFSVSVLSATLVFAQAPQAYAPSLGNAASFAVFGGGGGATNQGSNTILHGSLGTTSVSTAVTGFTDGVTGIPYTTAAGANNGKVTGGIYSNNGDPVTLAFASQTAADINTAYIAINPTSQPGGINPGAGQLGGLTLTPGVYKAVDFIITNVDLTLDAQGDPNAVWVIQSTASLTVGMPGAPRSVIMTNGGLARNVFWYVGSGAVINTGGGGVMCGTIISSAATTTSTAGSVIQTVINGRILCLNAGVTLVNTTVNACDTWTGITNNIWSTATNWSRGSVPIASEEVLIPNVLTVKPVVSSTTQSLFNLTIYTGSALTVTSTLQIAGFMKNQGIAFDATNGTITMNGVGTKTKNGTDPQVIPASTFTSSNTVQNLIINNGTGVTLGNGDINVSNLFTLSNGLLKTGTNNLIIANNATIAGASSTTYVDGNVRKIGNQAFTFPVGNLSKYAPITMSAPASATDHFTASYSYTNPNNSSYLTTSLGAGLNRVSLKEFWLLNRTNGTSNVDVTLSFDNARSGGITTLADLRVAQWNGTQWINQGNTALTGTTSNGTVKSNLALGAFGPFTLGSSTASNILPLSLLSFTAQQQNSKTNLAWQTSNEVNVSHFTIEQSLDGTNFNSIGKVNSNAAGNYSYTDNVASINATTIYYRLQIMDKNGSYTYSKTIAVMLKGSGSQLSIFPNPVKETMFVQVVATKAEMVTIHVVDMMGRILQQEIATVAVGNNSFSINVSTLTRGTYVLLVKSLDGMQQKQFIKQ